MRERAVLVLEDGTTYHGYAFGHRGKSVGEVVFNTAQTGYQEILTDPSYHGQIVVMTYPHQGNYGGECFRHGVQPALGAGFCGAGVQQVHRWPPGPAEPRRVYA